MSVALASGENSLPWVESSAPSERVVAYESEFVMLGIPTTVFGYLWRCEDGGWAMIDSGGDNDAAEQVLNDAVYKAGLSWDELREIWCLHTHPDHLGLATRISRKRGVPIWLPEAELPMVSGVHTTADVQAAYRETFGQMGAPESVLKIADQVANRFDKFARAAEYEAMPTGHRFEVVDTRGHSPGHVSLVHDDLIFVSDALVANGANSHELTVVAPGKPFRIYSHFEETIERLAVYDGLLAYSGHVPPGRLGPLRAATSRRLMSHVSRIGEAFAANADATIFEISVAAYPNYPALFSFVSLPFVSSVVAQIREVA